MPVISMTTSIPRTTGLRAQRFAEATSVLAFEACRLALKALPAGQDADVARRAAGQAREAAQVVERLGATGTATIDEVMEAAAWAMTSAAVAIAQGNAAMAAKRVQVE